MTIPDTNPQATGELLIETRNITKRYGDNRVLDGISLGVRKSEVICIIGPSGSGKSTLLRSLAFLEKYDEGEVLIEDKLLGYVGQGPGRRDATTAEINQVRRHVGMVFQQFNLWPHKTALGNVAEACRQRGLDRTCFYEWKRRFRV